VLAQAVLAVAVLAQAVLAGGQDVLVGPDVRGYSEVREPVIPPGLEAAVRAAADRCPERAITVS